MPHNTQRISFIETGNYFGCMTKWFDDSLFNS
jgi:hypothetical protein